MARPKKGFERGVILRSISFQIHDIEFVDGKEVDGADILIRGDGLRRNDLLGNSELAKLAYIEYIQRHDPGNPTVPLTTFIPGGVDLSVSAKEKLGMPANTRKFTCQRCGGEGCQDCGGLGFYYHEHL